MQHKRPHGHPLRCCSSACEATTVEIRVVTIGCTCMVQGGGWRRERAASPSTRAADSIARPSSLLLVRVVLAMRAAAVTRWWRACGREGRSCGLTAATSARTGCAVRCRRELVRTRVSSPAWPWSLCCESCVQCGPTVYSATRRACGRVEGNFWLLYHLANVRTLTRYTGSRHRCLHAQPPAVRRLQ